MAKGYSIGELAERIEVVFGTHYVRTAAEPDSWQRTLLSDRESNYDWEREGEPVVQAIANAAEMPEAAAQDIQTILEDEYADFDVAAIGEETEFSASIYYELAGTDDGAWQENWNAFERTLKTEARFFSKAAAEHLAAVFGGSQAMTSEDGRPLVIDAGPGTSLSALYRARVFQSDPPLVAALCRPDLQLGSPPANLATAGRMNAHGISVFYAASEARVAIAEVRPPVGSQVAVARFNIVRPLRLLDLTAVSAVTETGSIFDAGLAARQQRASFLRSLSQRITRAVMPDDEAIDYLPTQAIADFLATGNSPPLDGIVFPSVQAAHAALNIVLFHKAARVEAMEVPKGTEIEARTGRMCEEGWETEYTVIEEVPPAVSSNQTGSWLPNFDMAMAESRISEQELREPTLRIDAESIEVHIVQRVEFVTVEHHVSRHRWEKRELDLEWAKGRVEQAGEQFDDIF